MFILFSLIFMRMSGAIIFYPLLGRTNFPNPAKGALIFVLSLMLYMGVDGTLAHPPSGMLEYGVMLVKELFVGFVLGFSMELMFVVIRFASAIMDHNMGLSMAQVYDPQYHTQMTITSGIYYAFVSLMFLAMDGHVRLIALFFASARLIPFGEVVIRPEISDLMLEIFTANVAAGFQFAFPLIAMELVTEAAMGILMRMIPQINVFAVNFQLKIIVGLLMLLYMFSPFSVQVYKMIDNFFVYIQRLIGLMG